MLNIVVKAMGLLLCLYALAIASLYFKQRSMMYFPSHTDVPPRGNAEFAPWYSADPTFLGYVRGPAQPQRVFIVFHGNGGEALGRSWMSGLIAAEHVLILAEYPGYGAKSGEPSEASFVASARALLAEARQRWRLPITLIGESIGAGVATAVAGEQGVDRVALISPFSSALDIARRVVGPYFPLSLIMKDSFRSDLRLREVRVPLLIIHGVEDDIIPFDSGRQLYEGYTGPKQFVELPGAKHNDIAPFLLSDGNAQLFRRFLSEPYDRLPELLQP